AQVLAKQGLDGRMLKISALNYHDLSSGA
ncbi:hypothetical protein SAMN05421546_0013, partial [Solilutibacter tolerans]